VERGGSVYIVTNKSHSVLYTGVTSDLRSRTEQHREHFYKKSFSDRYNTEKLVYYELFGSIEEAIAREKEIKKWRREKKDALIKSMNPAWNDLWDIVKEW
jgi:putative endonuclease